MKPKAWLVALQVGGFIEHPGSHLVGYQIIKALTAEEAAVKYNDEHHCAYYYGQCLGEVVDGMIKLPVCFFLPEPERPDPL